MRTSILALVLAAGLSACAAPKVAVEARAMSLDIEGDLAAEDIGSGIAANTDLEALGLTASDDTFGGRVDIDLGSPHFTFYGLQAAYAGTGVASADIDLGGVTIPANADVDTDFDFSSYTGMLTFDLVPTDFVEVGIGIAVMLVDLDFSMTDVNDPANMIASDESIPVPLGALRAGVEFGRFEFDGSVAAIDLSLDEGDLSILDIDLAARLRLFGGKERLAGVLVVGYRSLELEAQYEDEGSDVDVNFLIDGPYVGLRITF